MSVRSFTCTTIFGRSRGAALLPANEPDYSPFVRTAISGLITPAWTFAPQITAVEFTGPFVPAPQITANAFGPARAPDAHGVDAPAPQITALPLTNLFAPRIQPIRTWDGTGYPAGLAGEKIPMGARILCAVDCLDALASDRQYRRELPLNEAMEYVASISGRSFDPKVIDVLKKHYHEFEALAKESPAQSSRLERML